VRAAARQDVRVSEGSAMKQWLGNVGALTTRLLSDCASEAQFGPQRCGHAVDPVDCSCSK
jgi:hypothetical protein